MYLIIVLLNLIVFILLIIGIFRPQKSLFWIKGKKTRIKSTLIYLILFFLLGGIGGTLNPLNRIKTSNTRSSNLLHKK